MSQITVSLTKVRENIAKLDSFLQNNHKIWTLTTKVLGANETVLKAILQEQKQLHSVADSHLRGLEIIKKHFPEMTTMYIRPPVERNAKNVVKYADISLNTSFRTIKALNDEAKKQGKAHRIIVMIEMGELREGVVREEFLQFYERIFNFSHIDVIGLGTNLGCMHGIEPTYDKLIQLCLYKQLLEAKFNCRLPLVSGGSSITLPLLEKGKLPEGINHFRIGEAVFLGTSPLYNERFLDLHTDVFELNANIIELYKKENQPDGNITEAAIGHVQSNEEEASYKAIVDFGMLDVDGQNLIYHDKSIKFFGNSSDLTVFDLGLNKKGFRSGGILSFKPNYMAVAKLMNSRFVEKIIIP